MQPIRVLVVDDALLSKEVIVRGLSQDSEIRVIGTASDPFEARDFIQEVVPDVITLDINMPKMDGITFLKKLMAQYPLPVVVISGSANKALDALEAGAVEFVYKPLIKSREELTDFINEIIAKVKIAAISKTISVMESSLEIKGVQTTTRSNKYRVIALGASTGGTEVILQVLQAMPTDCPGIVIVQHMPPVFTQMFADRLNMLCKIEVKEAKNGDRIERGTALIAPGEKQMTIYNEGRQLFVRCINGEKVSGHCPSVDHLFSSVARVARDSAIGVIMTGMGSDGAAGLLEMRQAGARTLGQDEKTCVVYGMPRVAFEIGAVEKQVPANRIKQTLCSMLDGQEKES